MGFIGNFKAVILTITGSLYSSYDRNAYSKFSHLTGSPTDLTGIGFTHVQGEIGILTRSDMDKFGYIFEHFQKLGTCDNQKGDHFCLHLCTTYEYSVSLQKKRP